MVIFIYIQLVYQQDQIISKRGQKDWLHARASWFLPLECRELNQEDTSNDFQEPAADFYTYFNDPLYLSLRNRGALDYGIYEQ